MTSSWKMTFELELEGFHRHEDQIHSTQTSGSQVRKKKKANSLDWFVEIHQEIILDKQNGASGGW